MNCSELFVCVWYGSITSYTKFLCRTNFEKGILKVASKSLALALVCYFSTPKSNYYSFWDLLTVPRRRSARSRFISLLRRHPTKDTHTNRKSQRFHHKQQLIFVRSTFFLALFPRRFRIIFFEFSLLSTYSLVRLQQTTVNSVP